MAGITEEVAGIEQQQGWEKLFFDIKKTSQYELSCKVAKLQENRGRNRYRDVSPYDHSRVKLQQGPRDYINSSHVEVSEASRRYILSQGPLPATSGHLWQMVWEQNSNAVIMLNKIIEKGMRKCDQYWPADKNYPLAYYEDGYMVTLINETDKQNFVIRELELLRIKDNATRIVYQFHYTAWPDFDVPQSPAAFLNFLACIRQYGVLDNPYGPAVIHCSAGIGRSGTFILIDACLELLQKRIPFEIKEILLEMRKYRMGLIQTTQQLRFSYFAIAECERILLFKESEENGYSDADVLSDAESEDYDQLCRDVNVTYDADEEDDAQINDEEHSVPSTNSDHHLNTTKPTGIPEVGRAESLSSIEDDVNSEMTPQPQMDSQNINENYADHSTGISKDNLDEIENRLPSTYADDVQETLDKLSEASSNDERGDAKLLGNEGEELQEKSESQEDNEQLQRTFEQNHATPETVESRLPVTPPLSQTDTAIDNTYKQKNPSITTFISPEKDTLRKRVFETDDVSHTETTSKAHEVTNLVNNDIRQTSWRPYLIGGLVISAFGALFIYSKL